MQFPVKIVRKDGSEYMVGDAVSLGTHLIQGWEIADGQVAESLTATVAGLVDKVAGLEAELVDVKRTVYQTYLPPEPPVVEPPVVEPPVVEPEVQP
jgi:hypothetical protein